MNELLQKHRIDGSTGKEEVPLLYLEPEKIEFRNIEPHTQYVQRIGIRNCSNETKRIRIKPPQHPIPNTEFKIKNLQPQIVTAGQVIFVDVEFYTTELKDCISQMTIFTEEFSQMVPLIGTMPCAIMSVDREIINFGTGNSKPQDVVVSNTGSLPGRFRIRTENKTSVTLSATNGELQPNEKLKIRLHMNANKPITNFEKLEFQWDNVATIVSPKTIVQLHASSRGSCDDKKDTNKAVEDNRTQKAQRDNNVEIGDNIKDTIPNGQSDVRRVPQAPSIHPKTVSYYNGHPPDVLRERRAGHTVSSSSKASPYQTKMPIASPKVTSDRGPSPYQTTTPIQPDPNTKVTAGTILPPFSKAIPSVPQNPQDDAPSKDPLVSNNNMGEIMGSVRPPPGGPPSIQSVRTVSTRNPSKTTQNTVAGGVEDQMVMPEDSLMRRFNQSGTWYDADPFKESCPKCLCEELGESFEWESDDEGLSSSSVSQRGDELQPQQPPRPIPTPEESIRRNWSV